MRSGVGRATVGTHAPAQGSVPERAARLFEFLTELQRLRTKVTRTLDSYDTVLWYADLPSDPRVVTPHSADVDDPSIWMAVERVEREDPPAPPQAVAPWLTHAALRNSKAAEPDLAQTIRLPVEIVGPEGDRTTSLEDRHLPDHPEVTQTYRQWLPTWLSWAVADRDRNAVATFYQQLYEIYQDARDSAETYEVVLSFGYLTCHSGGVAVRRHLLSARAGIDLDLDTGRLTVGPSPDGPKLTLEQDMLNPDDTVPPHVRTELDAQLPDAEGDPWAEDAIAGILRTWTNGVAADAEFHDDWRPLQPRSFTPAVSLAPALILNATSALSSRPSKPSARPFSKPALCLPGSPSSWPSATDAPTPPT